MFLKIGPERLFFEENWQTKDSHEKWNCVKEACRMRVVNLYLAS